MAQENANNFEAPNLVSVLAHAFAGTPIEHFLHSWENIIFSLLAMGILLVLTSLASRKISLIPNRLQSCVELFIEWGIDLYGGILGPNGKRFVPLGITLFIYILVMNAFGLIPFLKSPTASLSTTSALAICVFIYFLFTAIKENGVIGFLKHMAGDPKGTIVLVIFMWVMIFPIEVMTVLIRPFTLSLRLRGNIWGEDLLMSILTGFGFWGAPFLFFISLLSIITALVQALVFSLLTVFYFATILGHTDEHH